MWRTGHKQRKKKDRKSNWKRRRTRERIVESNGSPEIPDRRESSGFPCLPSSIQRGEEWRKRGKEDNDNENRPTTKTMATEERIK